MEDPVNMQDDVQRNQGWRATIASYFNSWIVFTLACYFFVLKVLQEFFKTGEIMKEEKISISTTGVQKRMDLRSAGEIQVENTKEESPHTVVVDVQPPSIPAPAAGSAPIVLAEPTKPVEPASDQSKNTLVIKNLPFKFKLTDLEKLLSEYAVKVKNVRLLRDESGKFTGMAFIRCGSKEDAQELITKMNNLDIAGRSIQVDFKTKNKKKKKLSASSDSMSSSSSDWEEKPSKLIEELKPFRRKSTSDYIHSMPPRNEFTTPFRTDYVHSAVSRIHAASKDNTIRPIRQPIGPDGKTNGFSEDYRRSRTIKM